MIKQNIQIKKNKVIINNQINMIIMDRNIVMMKQIANRIKNSYKSLIKKYK